MVNNKCANSTNLCLFANLVRIAHSLALTWEKREKLGARALRVSSRNPNSTAAIPRWSRHEYRHFLKWWCSKSRQSESRREILHGAFVGTNRDGYDFGRVRIFFREYERERILTVVCDDYDLPRPRHTSLYLSTVLLSSSLDWNCAFRKCAKFRNLESALDAEEFMRD